MKFVNVNFDDASMDSEDVACRPARAFMHQIQNALVKRQVKSTHNRRACMVNVMNVEEARARTVASGGLCLLASLGNRCD